MGSSPAEPRPARTPDRTSSPDESATGQGSSADQDRIERFFLPWMVVGYERSRGDMFADIVPSGREMCKRDAPS